MSCPRFEERQGFGTFVSAERMRLADRERRRILEQRIDALLTEAHQLDFSLEEVFRLIHRRQAPMSRAAPALAALAFASTLLPLAAVGLAPWSFSRIRHA